MGIDSAYVEYLINTDKQKSVRLNLDSLNNYSAYLVFNNGLLSPGDSIRYRLVAVDTAIHPNIAYCPNQGYYTVKVEDISGPQDEYQNDFNNLTDDFLMTGFSITTPPGFSNGGLHTKHPYESPDQDNQEINYIAQLKIPIILKKEDAYMSFDEIVLVEPGESGTKWGDDKFWDYVIIEGSKDKGKNWHYIQKGYDCRKHNEWLTRYNSSFISNNSVAVGSPELYKKSLVNLLENSYFSGGDTILIRFRLFSDPYAHGWGWAIDNLKIQGSVSSVWENSLDNSLIDIYPNPCNGTFCVKMNEKGKKDIDVYSAIGSLIYTRHNIFSNQIQVFLEKHKPGIYIIIVRSSGNRRVIGVKKIIITDR